MGNDACPLQACLRVENSETGMGIDDHYPCLLCPIAILKSTSTNMPSTHMPFGMAINNIEISCEIGRQLARAASVVAKLIAKESKLATLRLPRGDLSGIPKLLNNSWTFIILLGFIIFLIHAESQNMSYKIFPLKSGIPRPISTIWLFF